MLLFEKNFQRKMEEDYSNALQKPLDKIVSEQKIRTLLGTNQNSLFQSRPICHVIKKH